MNDQSASPETLAQRAAIRGLLPAAITAFRDGDSRCVRLELNGHFSCRRAGLTKRAREFLGEARERVASKTELGGRTVWVAVDPDGVPLTPLQMVLRWSLERERNRELEGRRRVLADAFDRIGWHEVAVPTPDGEPEVRIGAVVRFGPASSGPAHPLQASELRADMDALRTLKVAPDDIEEALQQSRLLYARGWNQWEFLTLAKREAVFALEAALRKLDARHRGRASNRSFATLLREVGRSSDPRVLSEWERVQAHRLRGMRNALTHHEGGPFIDWISWARQGMAVAIRIIDLVWARELAAVPEELFWERQP